MIYRNYRDMTQEMIRIESLTATMNNDMSIDGTMIALWRNVIFDDLDPHDGYWRWWFDLWLNRVSGRIALEDQQWVLYLDLKYYKMIYGTTIYRDF